MFRIFFIFIILGISTLFVVWNGIDYLTGGPNRTDITVYTSLSQEKIDDYLPQFNKAYPHIQTTIVQRESKALAEKLLAEKHDIQADVIWGLPVTDLLLLEWRSVLSRYAPIGLERVGQPFRDTEDPPHWVGQNIRISAFCINREKLEALDLPYPHTWQDLTKPIYKGYLAFPDPTLSSTGYMWASAILQIYGEEEGWAILDSLHENTLIYTENGTKPCELTKIGSTPIGVSHSLAGLAQLAESDHIELIFPTEGSGWDMDGNALVKQHTMKDAAKTFLDWAISDTTMQMYGKDFAITSVPIEGGTMISGHLENPINQLYDKDIPEAAANRNQIQEMWMIRYQ